MAIFPDTAMLPEAVIPERKKLILLKFCTPIPLILIDGASNETVLVLPLNVPSLIQLPLMVCALLLPLNIHDAPIEILPLTVISDPAV